MDEKVSFITRCIVYRTAGSSKKIEVHVSILPDSDKVHELCRAENGS